MSLGWGLPRVVWLVCNLYFFPPVENFKEKKSCL